MARFFSKLQLFTLYRKYAKLKSLAIVTFSDFAKQMSQEKLLCLFPEVDE